MPLKDITIGVLKLGTFGFTFRVTVFHRFVSSSVYWISKSITCIGLSSLIHFKFDQIYKDFHTAAQEDIYSKHSLSAVKGGSNDKTISFHRRNEQLFFAARSSAAVWALLIAFVETILGGALLATNVQTANRLLYLKDGP